MTLGRRKNALSITHPLKSTWKGQFLRDFSSFSWLLWCFLWEWYFQKFKIWILGAQIGYKREPFGSHKNHPRIDWKSSIEQTIKIDKSTEKSINEWKSSKKEQKIEQQFEKQTKSKESSKGSKNHPVIERVQQILSLSFVLCFHFFSFRVEEGVWSGNLLTSKV